MPRITVHDFVVNIILYFCVEMSNVKMLTAEVTFGGLKSC